VAVAVKPVTDKVEASDGEPDVVVADRAWQAHQARNRSKVFQKKIKPYKK
jgi:hypothetical protein